MSLPSKICGSAAVSQNALFGSSGAEAGSGLSIALPIPQKGCRDFINLEKLTTVFGSEAPTSSQRGGRS